MGTMRRSGIRILALMSPLWAFACHVDLTRVPDLEFDTGESAAGIAAISIVPYNVEPYA